MQLNIGHSIAQDSKNGKYKNWDTVRNPVKTSWTGWYVIWYPMQICINMTRLRCPNSKYN